MRAVQGMKAGAVRTPASAMGVSSASWSPSSALQRGADRSATSVRCQPSLGGCVWWQAEGRARDALAFAQGGADSPWLQSAAVAVVVAL